jgi:isocitrate lyase
VDHITQEAARLAEGWRNDPRWEGIVREYSAEEVVRLRGSIREQQTLAFRMSEKLWGLLNSEDYVHALGALSGGQAVQMVKAGLKSIYLSGWQVAGDGNLSGEVYPDQSQYPSNSAPAWSDGSTMRCGGPIRSIGPMVTPTPTGSSRSWPMVRPDSVGR